jgi:hypothetical protein
MRRVIAIIALFIMSITIQGYIEPQETTTVTVTAPHPSVRLEEDKDYASGELDEAPGLQPEYAKRTGKI